MISLRTQACRSGEGLKGLDVSRPVFDAGTFDVNDLLTLAVLFGLMDGVLEAFESVFSADSCEVDACDCVGDSGKDSIEETIFVPVLGVSLQRLLTTTRPWLCWQHLADFVRATFSPDSVDKTTEPGPSVVKTRRGPLATL